MRISVVHSTEYRYDAPVFQEPHTFRLRPRSDASQNLLRYSIEISPTPAGRSWCLDQDGNVVLEAWFHEPMEKLSVVSSFEVETTRENPFDFLARGGEPASALQPYLAGDVEAAVTEFARSIEGGDTLSFLWQLNGVLFQQFAHTIREDGPAEEAGTTLAARSGSCRDLSVLFCAACRSRGIPARFVSGYEREAAYQAPSHMHAWAEVYLPGGGWRGYDPTAGVAVSTTHVALAAAADPREAAPIGGTYRGAAKASMSYGIQMQISS
jgi:transglutaminase-like putative cysteine protease